MTALRTRHVDRGAADGRPLALEAGPGLLALPFDALRFQYASAVMAGVIRRSIVASGRLEQSLGALERLILGPLARQR